MHLDLGADVDASGGFVDDEDFRPQGEPAREHNLLLIAAGEIGDDLILTCHADIEHLAEFLDQRALRGVIHEDAPAGDLFMRRHAEIGAHREREEQRLLLAVFGNQADAVADGVLRGADVDLLAVDQDAAAVDAVRSEYRPRRLGASGADQPGEAQDLAATNLEGDVFKHGGVSVLRISAPGKAFDAKRDVADFRRSAMGVERCDVASDHQADDLVDARLRDHAGADLPAITQNRVAIADLEHLLETVGHEDDAEAARLEITNDAKQLFDLVGRQRRRRLVHDQQPGVHRKRARDLHHLLLGHAKVADERHRPDIEPEPARDRQGVRGHLAPIHERAQARLAADEDVLGDRHIGREGEFLIDRRDAEALSRMRRRKRDLLAGKRDRAFIRLLSARQDFQKARLAGSIFAEKRVNLAWSDFEIHIVERQNAGEAFADRRHVQRGSVHSFAVSAFH